MLTILGRIPGRRRWLTRTATAALAPTSSSWMAQPDLKKASTSRDLRLPRKLSISACSLRTLVLAISSHRQLCGQHPANKPATRHVNMRMHMLRQHVEVGHVSTPFCPTFDLLHDQSYAQVYARSAQCARCGFSVACSPTHTDSKSD